MTCPECTSSNLDYDMDNDQYWCKDCGWHEPLVEDYDESDDYTTDDDHGWERVAKEWDDD